MSWTEFETPGAPEHIQISTAIRSIGNVTLYEWKEGRQNLYSIIKKSDDKYFIWETDFTSQDDAELIMNTFMKLKCARKGDTSLGMM